jgi:hypothetical protein
LTRQTSDRSFTQSSGVWDWLPPECLMKPAFFGCVGTNDCHQHTVSNFFFGEDLDTGYWGGKTAEEER